MAKPARFWTCSACGETVVNLPMQVFRHQLIHVERRPFAGVRVPEPENDEARDQPEQGS